MLKLVEDLGMLYPTKTSKQKSRYGIYKCDCGSNVKLRTASVKSGDTVSCGCYRKEILDKTKHGLSNHRIYKTWSSMIRRCSNKKDANYKNYGGRGISVCDRWNDVSNFIEDMYPTFKEGLSIHRVNNDGNYEPSNCAWENKNTQARVTRKVMSTNTSGYRGVSEKNGKFQATIGIDGKYKYLGLFLTAEEAAKAYDKYVLDNNLQHTINGV